MRIVSFVINTRISLHPAPGNDNKFKGVDLEARAEGYQEVSHRPPRGTQTDTQGTANTTRSLGTKHRPLPCATRTRSTYPHAGEQDSTPTQLNPARCVPVVAPPRSAATSLVQDSSVGQLGFLRPLRIKNHCGFFCHLACLSRTWIPVRSARCSHCIKFWGVRWGRILTTHPSQATICTR